MLILAMESSAKAASAALVRDDTLLAQSFSCSALTHSRTLLPMAEQALDTAGVRLEEVDCLAVAHGPGSFTGIRIGVSAVKGLAWAAEKPAVGVSTLEAMAYNGLAAGEGALVCCCMDARRSQIYHALFEIRGGKPERLMPDRAIAIEALLPELKKYEKPLFLVGDGAALCYNIFSEQDQPCVLAPGNLVQQSAWGVAMAAQAYEPGPGAALQPVYLRLSQAERERQARMAQQ
ncbi:MAG: tRNA (adenosine(37)-N6)-threonylcarbamoyltransferase complex dimerization subunit type 1 TsaB [Oscillospiraceae bacterium]|nr:tRNA (adenosine(37)-N6)-threonylcarbamoyltransferase complex dimerization subunit type 1 TsaB [Oscillospiraceae bacterium]